MGSLAHARRKYFKATGANLKLSQEEFELIRKMYAGEKFIRDQQLTGYVKLE